RANTALLLRRLAQVAAKPLSFAAPNPARADAICNPIFSSVTNAKASAEILLRCIATSVRAHCSAVSRLYPPFRQSASLIAVSFLFADWWRNRSRECCGCLLRFAGVATPSTGFGRLLREH